MDAFDLIDQHSAEEECDPVRTGHQAWLCNEASYRLDCVASFTGEADPALQAAVQQAQEAIAAVMALVPGPYVCIYCDAEFTDEEALAAHECPDDEPVDTNSLAYKLGQEAGARAIMHDKDGNPIP